MIRASFCLLTAALLLGCGRRGDTPLSYDPPGSTLTTSKPISTPHARLWKIDGVGVATGYSGARLNSLDPVNDTLLVGSIRPENAPINNSGWFGFKVWADEPRSVWIRLAYEDGDHRYVPKLSPDGTSWTPIAGGDYRVDTTGTRRAAEFKLNVGPDTLWVSGQERLTSAFFADWIDGVAETASGNWAGAEAGSRVLAKQVATSTYGAPIRALEFGNPAAREYVLAISRQHPPEVTGTLALLPFVERLLGDDPEAVAFRDRYRTLVVPLMNPDGVDDGHWRHNAGGVDLNRDWLNFNQPETRAVSQYFVDAVGEGRVLFAIDFHSTQNDVFYTTSRHLETNAPGLIDQWLEDIGQALPDYYVNDDPSGVDSPVSKAWFYKQFGTTSLTYEVGDEQDRDRIRQVAVAGAESMMKRLIALPQD